MNIGTIFGRLSRFANNNSPALLTAMGVVGVVATAYLTAKATAKAVEVIRVDEEDHGELTEFKHKVELVWKDYIPPVVAATVTIGCIVAANRIGTRRMAAVAAVAAISERAYEEYRDKVREKIGEHRERTIRDEVAQEMVKNNPPNREVIVASGEVLFMDSITRRYFTSTVETVRRAVNDINAQILEDYSASLSDFYDLIGLRRTEYSDEVGWNLDNKLKVNFTTTMTEEQKPCMVINYSRFPEARYDNIH